MSNQILAEHCSATFAGLKTGNLFSIKIESKEQLIREMRQLNKVITKKGLRAIPVKYTAQSALIYLYRPDYLSRDLRHPAVAAILKEKGYTYEDSNVCIAQLIARLRTEKEFPHEIGLFLGYPPEDVQGFMNSPNKGVKCVGYWKVYGNKEEAEKTFRQYRRCRDIYCREITNGRPLEQMIVETRDRDCTRVANI